MTLNDYSPFYQWISTLVGGSSAPAPAPTPTPTPTGLSGVTEEELRAMEYYQAQSLAVPMGEMLGVNDYYLIRGEPLETRQATQPPVYTSYAVGEWENDYTAVIKERTTGKVLGKYYWNRSLDTSPYALSTQWILDQLSSHYNYMHKRGIIEAKDDIKKDDFAQWMHNRHNNKKDTQ